MAGDVALFEGAHLYIRGDHSDNQLEIVVEGEKLKVNGLDGTTINGRSSYTLSSTNVTASGVTFGGGIRAHLASGSDDLSVTDATFESVSIIYGGRGDDNIEVLDSHFGDKTVIQTFDGDDTITISGTSFDGNLFAVTLDGEDTVSMANSIFNGGSYVLTGDHTDSVFSEDNEYLSATNLVLTFGGDDSVHVKDPVVMEHLGIFLGHGDDTINGDLMGAQVERTLRIGGQAGTDEAPAMRMTDEVAANVIVGTVERRQVFDGGADTTNTETYGVLSQVNEVTNVGDRYMRRPLCWVLLKQSLRSSGVVITIGISLIRIKQILATVSLSRFSRGRGWSSR